MKLPRYIISVEEEKEYYDNGILKYECYWGVIQKGYHQFFSNRRDFKLSEDGHWRVRIFQATKYNIFGDIEWRHIYDNFGNVFQAIKGVSSFNLRHSEKQKKINF